MASPTTGPAVFIELLGDKELADKFLKFTPNLQKKIERSSLRAAAKPLQAAIKRNIPVLTGALRRSVKVRALRRSRKNKNRVGVRVVTNASDNLFKGETFYGGFLEFGTSRQPPQAPFKRGATEAKDQVKSIFTSEMQKRVRETANELRGSSTPMTG